MGGKPKGLLRAPGGEPILERWRRIFGRLGLEHVLVGAHHAYASFGVALDDHPGAEGPLAGLLALLEHARGSVVIAVACDMPYVSERLVARLVAAPPAAIVAPRRNGRWEPFFARYDAARVLPGARARAAQGKMALQGLLDSGETNELVLDPGESDQLHDWDTPEDVARSYD